MKIAVVGLILNTHSGSRAPIEIARSLQGLGHTVKFYATPHHADPTINLDCDFFLNPRHLHTQLLRFKPDIISTHTTLPYLIACKLTGFPIVGHYYGTQFNVWAQRFLPLPPFVITTLDIPTNFFIFCIGWIMAHLPINMIAISRFAQTELLRLYNRSSQVVYLGGPTITKPSTHKHTKVNLLSISRITPYKNFHHLIKLVGYLPSSLVHYTIVGSSPVPRYLAYLRSLNPSLVTIHTDISDARLSQVLSTADIYLNADRYLFFGLPIIEAARYHIPTVSFSYGAAPELVNHTKTGYIVNRDSDFVAYLVTMLTHPKLLTSLGRAANAYCHRFSWATSAKHLTTIYSQHVL